MLKNMLGYGSTLLLLANIAISTPLAQQAQSMEIRQSDKICAPLSGNVGIKEPAPGTTITLDPNNPTNITVVFCSGQYFKTRSIDVSVGLASPGQENQGGALIAKNVEPDNQDTNAGYYSYRFQATIPYASVKGKQSLILYETATGKSAIRKDGEPRSYENPLLTPFPGYGNPLNYKLFQVEVNLA